MIWKKEFDAGAINAMGRGTMGGHIGIEFTECGDDFLIARMPVDQRTIQPFGILHGGASAALAETAGSVASTLCLEDAQGKTAVGIELNISHLRAARSGFIYATVRPARIGRRLHVWHIENRDDRNRLVSVGRLTMAVVDRQSENT